MKIAMILRRLNTKGGTQRQALSLAVELRKRGHEIVLYTFYYAPEKCYTEMLNNFKVIHLSENALKEAEHVGFPFNRIPPMRYGMTGNRMARALAELMDRDFDILNPHDQMAYKVACYYKKLCKDTPSVWVMNDPPALQWGYDRMKEVDEEFSKPLWRRIGYFLFDQYDRWRCIRHQDAIVTNDFFNGTLVKKYYGYRTFAVRNGPDFEHFRFEKKEPPHKAVKILTSGIFMPHRRYQDAIRAIPLLLSRGIDATLTIIGALESDIVYGKKIQKLIAELNLEKRVKLAGRVSEQELIDAYHDHDMYTFQHHLQGDGLSPFEAAASGMPLIISKTAGCHEILTDRENVLLLEPKNPEDYADKVAELVNSPALFSRLAEAANTFARANLSWENYADGVFAIMEKVKREGPQIKL